MKTKKQTQKRRRSELQSSSLDALVRRWSVEYQRRDFWILHSREISEAEAEKEREWLLRKEPSLKVRIVAPNDKTLPPEGAK